ncbi:MAG: hypothetical protein KKE62_06915 [Proteobacteria bacterium]|nr:hypothetical protein [Pseudomonadota bacterium]MBU1389623.1 hypothetical protein [Pseudomonadota bacterium]MBU1542561.1 hypothetical protein [Pseudomonadota bacterium]MBU2479484.1 hypothetical protein [Pseudomonadota bacterium]
MSKTDDPSPDTTMFDLRGKQSVRATFKLSQKAIDAIGLVAIHMGIKQKSLFDHIIEDLDALDSLARTIRIQQFKKIPRIQKTFVLSRKTIDALGSISQEHGTPRDALVEYSIQKLESIITAEKLRHIERKLLLKDVSADLEQLKKTYKKAAGILGTDDPFCRQMAKTVYAAQKTKEELMDFLEKSKVLEAY